MKIFRIIASLVLAAYFLVPLIDSMACEECIGFTRNAMNRTGFSDPVDFSIAGNKTDTESSTPDQTTKDGECQVCFNAAKIVSTRSRDIVFSSLLFTSYVPPLTPQIFASSPFKPPEITA